MCSPYLFNATDRSSSGHTKLRPKQLLTPPTTKGQQELQRSDQSMDQTKLNIALVLLQDSLAAEIEGTMRKELSMDDPECEEQKVHRRRVFETVKNVNQTVRQRSLTPTSNIPGSNQSLSARTSPQSSGLSTPYSSMYGGDVSGDSVALDNRTQSILMEKAANQDSSSEGREKKAAGAEDLRLALRRLSLRRQNNLSERRFFEEERVRKRGGNEGLHDAMGQESGMTPSESIMSLGNLHLWTTRGPYLPDKLQIVKPLEGEGERENQPRCKAGRKREGDKQKVIGTKKGSKRSLGTEGERERGWGWVRKTRAGIERDRGRRWAKDRAGSRKGKAAKERPLPLMLFNSFWSLMHRHKSGSFASPHSYYKDTQPRGWL
ncbi:trafficking kinesin-binding protein 1-like [Notothenia coriiceps]|uniref:Trafficking kinesin-binding protein 1-like n=1 Tax=Notothenia coriiceps TaxID=8208 RepID=A0A6I9Q103_9TELE|nr:PREDICTED: trafficking kinesin-binding protein 1-like [Notothenia coriiceps]